MTGINYKKDRFHQNNGETKFYIAQLVVVEEHPVYEVFGTTEAIDVTLVFVIFDALGKDINEPFIINEQIRKDFKVYQNNGQMGFTSPMFKNLSGWCEGEWINLSAFKDELFILGVELNTSNTTNRSFLNIVSLFLLNDEILRIFKEQTFFYTDEEESEDEWNLL